MRMLAAAVAALLVAGTAGADVVAEAIGDPSRLDSARVRDEARKPADIIRFAGLSAGDSIVELTPGGGYYTALLSRVVGRAGKVYAVDPVRIFEHFPAARDGFGKFLAQDPLTNVEYAAQKLDQLEVPAGLDQVWLVLYYHDTLWTGVDRAAMNRRIFEVLRPGGVFLVVDHGALPGAPESVGRRLHRMDESIARREILAAGFVLQAESDVLRNADDPLTDSVFDPERRGRTSRFVYRFVKP